MKTSLIPWLLLLTLAAACKKDEVNALPKATQEGKNTMGCLVDSKAWKPYEAIQLGGGNPYAVYWQLRDNGRQVSLTMYFDRDSGSDKTPSAVYIYVPHINNISPIPLDQLSDPWLASTNPAYANYIDTGSTPNVHYLTGPTATGSLTLTRFDTVARVVSGTFAFTGRAADGRTVQVSNGRFDMRLERR